MKSDRLRVTLDVAYSEALGLAAFCWARCEWDVAWCCERLQPNYLASIEAERKTAGTMANDLLRFVRSIGDPRLRAKCMQPAIEFKRLVEERNGLMHGKPGSASNGDQRLFRNANEWTIDAVNDLSDAFTACQIQLNNLVHNDLAATGRRD